MLQHDFILLDRSGSMANLWDEALVSINSYVKKLADDKVDTGVTLVAFDTDAGTFSFNVLRDRITPSTWRNVTNADAMPRGMTPLNDATGRIVGMAVAGGYDKVAIIIMTDGAENASTEYAGTFGTQRVKALLDQCRSKNWQVIFLGANFDNAQQAASYGNAAGQTVNMARGNLGATMNSLNSSRASYGATGQSINFSDEEKEDLGTVKTTARK